MNIAAILRNTACLCGLLLGSQAFAGEAVSGSQLTLSISPGAAQIIRAWRVAHGLESSATASLPAAPLAPAFAQPAGWQQRCAEDGGAMHLQPEPSDAAVGDRTADAVRVQSGACV